MIELYDEDKNKHNKAVAEVMYEYAGALGVDKEVAYTVGLLHDVGYIIDSTNHGELGANILSRIGVQGDALTAVKFHGVDPYKLIDEGKIKYISPLLILVWFADSTVDKYGNKCGFASRLKDVEGRYGTDSKAYRSVSSIQKFLRNLLHISYDNGELIPRILPMSSEELMNKLTEIAVIHKTA